MSVGVLPVFNTDGALRQGYVYLLVCKDADGPRYMKIGHTINPGSRLSQLLTGCPIPPKSFAVCPVGFIHSGCAAKVEKSLHKAFKHRLVRGEWFLIDTESQEDRELFHATFNKACFGTERGVWSHISIDKWQAAQKARKAYWGKQSKAAIKRAQDLIWAKNHRRVA